MKMQKSVKYRSKIIFRNIAIYIQIYNILVTMSHLIDLFETTEQQNYVNFKQQLKGVFLSGEYLCSNVVDGGTEISFFIQGNFNSFRLTTLWKCKFKYEDFSIQVNFYNKNHDDFLRASTSRMKYQLANLVGLVNTHTKPILINHFIPNTQLFMPIISVCRFSIDSQSGALKLNCYLKTSDFQKLSYVSRIKEYIRNIFMFINFYGQLIYFLQPCNDPKEKQSRKIQSIENRIHRLQHMLKDTQSNRQAVYESLYRILNIKQSNNLVYMNMLPTINIYINNVQNFHKHYQGLEDVSCFQIEKKTYEKELHQKTRHEKGVASGADRDLDRIVFGITQITQKKQLTQKQKQVEQEGGHSYIFKNIFEYYVADTIYSGTVDYKNQMVRQAIGKKKQGQLTYKICKKDDKVAKNSFLNQLSFLRYVRDMINPYIARYYLKTSDKWDQQDTIYMATYEKNVYRLLESRNLIMKSKLQLCYKMAKGLCFLFAKRTLHRDFKHLNVVVDKSLTPKLIDFGSCAPHLNLTQSERQFGLKPFSLQLATSQIFQFSYFKYKQKKIRQKTNPNGMLKILKHPQFNQHPLFDIYSFGKTLCHMFFKSFELPVIQRRNQQYFDKVQLYLIFLIDRCIDYDPDNRPSIGEVTAYVGQKTKLSDTEQSSAETDKKNEQQSRGQESKTEDKQKNKDREKQKDKDKHRSKKGKTKS